MGTRNTSARVATQVLVVAALVIGGLAVQAQQSGKTAVLWKDPGNIAALDLFWGRGAAERAPKGPFTFLKVDSGGGVQPKMDVRDAAGREWDVKFGEEVHAEIAANRLVWALGYVAEEIYFVPKGTVTGIADPGKLKEFITPDGSFTRASFRLRGDSKRAEQRWTFESNPFVKTPELSGLAVLMTMLCNWDIQGTRNNRILTVNGEAHYIVSDLGATFGKMGTFPAPKSKWNLEDFRKEEFIEKIEDGELDLDYEGYGGINKVPVEHARWFLRLASRLTDQQLRAAIRASGATDAEIAGFSARLREKLAELQKAVETP